MQVVNERRLRQRAGCCKGDRIDIVKPVPVPGETINGCIWGFFDEGERSVGGKQRAGIGAFPLAFSPRLLDSAGFPPTFITERYASAAGCRKMGPAAVSRSVEEKDDVATVAVQLAAAVGLRAFRAGARPGQQGLR